MRERNMFAVLLPFLAVITIAVFAGGLGVIFMLLESTAMEEWGVVLLGLIILISVPSIAALAQRAVDRRE